VSTAEPSSGDGAVEPDPRFLLANERTYLAYTRTALALIAVGLAVSEFLDQAELAGIRRALGVVLVALGGLVAFRGFSRWEAVTAALREGRPLPPNALPRVLLGGMVVVAVLSLVVVAWGVAD
jgi:putative membrane protein